MAREPVVAGKFYESDFTKLDKELNGCFSSKLGPGELPIRRDDEQKIKAIIVPHAGYFYSGPCAAWAYKEIAERHLPKTYVILGFSHGGMPSGISIEDWKTPFGIVKTDKDLAIYLKDNTSLKINESVHEEEHSIEVQVPFLQFVNRDALGTMKILPISFGRDLDFEKIALELSKALKSRDVVYIVSSDFTHYGRNYGYVPFTTDIQAKLKDLDVHAIKLINSLDINGFSDFLNRSNITICGYYPILLLMKILSLDEEPSKGNLLMYYTSAEISGDYSTSVSYVSILFK
jgi:AmmeMemoRadiSam system protein B